MHADYASFSSPKELLEKVIYYLEHKSDREAIARSGYEKVTNIYNARNAWGYIFTKIGFEPPPELKADKNFQAHEERMECLSK